ncbi:MAG: hypothetical protein H3Z50_05960 [archaeon]|nr:hypothetical protein [archaeon]
MPIKAAMWVHGNVVEVENPKPSLKVTKWGWGSSFEESIDDKVEYWFHISIPTPVILDGVRPPLNKIFIYYQTGGKGVVYLDEIHIWDGGSKKGWVWKASGVDPYPHPKEWVIDPPITINFGLGISVRVVFGKPSAGEQLRWINFQTAGADFITS